MRDSILFLECIRIAAGSKNWIPEELGGGILYMAEQFFEAVKAKEGPPAQPVLAQAGNLPDEPAVKEDKAEASAGAAPGLVRKLVKGR